MTVAQVQSAISGTKKYSMVAKSAKPAVWRNLTAAIESYNAALAKEHFDKRIVGFFAERNYIREYPSGSLVSFQPIKSHLIIFSILLYYIIYRVIVSDFKPFTYNIK